MIKLEMVHNESVLKELKYRCANLDIQGFTTVQVYASYGKKNGLYEEESLRPKYHTFLIAEHTVIANLVADLKKQFHQKKLYIFTSAIDLI